MSSGFARQINGVVGGDLSGSLPNPTVVGITGNPILPTTLLSINDGYVPTWVNADEHIEWKAQQVLITNIIGVLAGDTTGPLTSNTVIALQGNPVSSSSPSSGSLLEWSGSAWTPTITSLTGDVSGSINTSITVTGLQTVPIVISGLLSGDLLQYNGTDWVNTDGNVGSVGGDVVGSIGDMTVQGFQQRPVISTPPSSGQVYMWSGSQWAPNSLNGDVYGALDSNTVQALQGFPVSNASPSTGYLLTWNGSYWVPAIPSLNGDVYGSLYSNTVQALQGFPVSNASPSTNYLLEWNGSQWAPSIPSLNGDVYGSLYSNTVRALQGSPVSSYAPSTNNVLTWNGSQWTPSPGFTPATYYPLLLTQSTTSGQTNTGGSNSDQIIEFGAVNSYTGSQQFNNLTFSTEGTTWGAYLESGTVYGSAEGNAFQNYMGTYNSPSPYTAGQVFTVVGDFHASTESFSGQMLLNCAGGPAPGVYLNITSTPSYPAQIYIQSGPYYVGEPEGGTFTSHNNIYNPYSNTYSSTYNSESGISVDNIIAVDTTSEEQTIILPTPDSNYIQFPTFTISDVSGNASASSRHIIIKDNSLSVIATINVDFGSITVLWTTNSTSVNSNGTFNSGIWVITSSNFDLSPPTLATISSPVNTQTSNYSVVQYSDYNIFVDTTTAAAPVSITLDATPVNGETYYVKDSTGSAATYNITVSGSVNIDGASTYVINLNYACVAFTYNGSQWSVMGTYNGTLI